MKVFQFLTLSSFFLYLNLHATGVDTRVKLRGLAQLGESYVFSIHDTETKQSKWIESGQTFAGFTITGYDANRFIILGYYNNQLLQLSITESVLFKDFLTEGEKPLVCSGSEIKRLVNDFRNQELEKLPDESEPLFYILKQSAENRIATYENNLLSLNQDNSVRNRASRIEDKTTSLNNKSPRIIGQIRQNYVNSRIWASDHIEQFGLPEI